MPWRLSHASVHEYDRTHPRSVEWSIRVFSPYDESPDVWFPNNAYHVIYPADTYRLKYNSVRLVLTLQQLHLQGFLSFGQSRWQTSCQDCRYATEREAASADGHKASLH